MGEAAPKAERVRFAIHAGEIAGWRWPRAGARRLVFCHANGFCASAYKRALAPAAAVFDVVAIDMRGHGRTRLPADPRRLKSWDPFAKDIAAVLDILHKERADPLVVGGHSFGAVAAAMAARGRRDISALALIEPVATPPLAAAFARLPLWPVFAGRMPLVRGARSRRAVWPDRQSAHEVYSTKPLFAAWKAGCLENYLEDGIVETTKGARLACAPEWEAAVFAAQAQDFWGAVRDRTARLSVLAADHRGSTLFFGAIERFHRAGATVEKLGGASHLLPMEAPEQAAAFLMKSAAT